jgi:hypothetical protein
MNQELTQAEMKVVFAALVDAATLVRVLRRHATFLFKLCSALKFQQSSLVGRRRTR